VEAEGLKLVEVDEAARKVFQAVVAKHERDERRYTSELVRNGGQVIATQIQDFKSNQNNTTSEYLLKF